MIIKASGYQLADVSETNGYSKGNHSIIRNAFLSSNSLDDITDEEGKRILDSAFIDGKRPSIETFLHAVSGKYTLHTHPVVVNALTCRTNWISEVKSIFPDVMCVPYATPGVELAKEYFKVYKEQNNLNINVCFLQNHGLVVSAENADEVISLTEKITGDIEDYLGLSRFHSYHNLTKIWFYIPDKVLWKVTDENVLRMYRNTGLWNHRFCPDCIVFLGKAILSLKSDFSESDISEFIESNSVPSVIEYENELYICSDSVKKALEIQSVLSFSAQVMEVNTDDNCRFLSDPEQNYLIGWDAEKYRKNIKQEI